MTVLTPGRFDYEFMGDTLAELEERYSYNKEAAREVITHEMEAQGAALGDDGFWHYNGEPVKLLFVIRNDDPDQARLHLGNYIADELESIGFKVQRISKTRTALWPFALSVTPGKAAGICAPLVGLDGT